MPFFSFFSSLFLNPGSLCVLTPSNKGVYSSLLLSFIIYIRLFLFIHNLSLQQI